MLPALTRRSFRINLFLNFPFELDLMLPNYTLLHPNLVFNIRHALSGAVYVHKLQNYRESITITA